MGLRLTHIPGPQTPRGCLRRVRGPAILWLHCPSPKLAQQHTKRDLSGLWSLQWAKESPRWISSSPSIMSDIQSMHWSLASWGWQEDYALLNQRGSEYDWGIGLNSTQIVIEQVSLVGVLSREPRKWLLFCRATPMATLEEWTQLTVMPDSGPQTITLPALKTFFYHLAEAWLIHSMPCSVPKPQPSANPTT